VPGQSPREQGPPSRTRTGLRTRALPERAPRTELRALQLNYARHTIRAVRYPPGHREQSRARILRAAAELFRSQGIAATGVDRVMARAGLTAGGFYAHFRSKERLVADAVDAAAEASRKRWYGRFDDLRGRAWASALLDTYLSQEHRDDRARGCLLPSLGGEVPRAGRAARLGFERRLAGLFEFAALRVNGALPAKRAEIVAALALCVGGVLLARAVVTPALSREILASARSGAGQLLGLERAQPPRRPKRPKHRTGRVRAKAKRTRPRANQRNLP
jgi:TetR/AcrR family transcriptional regulator, transcriptional repressor for nem operon